MTRSLRTLLSIAGALVVIAATTIGYLAWKLRPQPPDALLPELVKNLPGSAVADMQKAFRLRVRARFPEGMAADELMTALRQEGFKPGLRGNGLAALKRAGLIPEHSSEDALPPLYSDYVEQHGGMCLRRWQVQWRRDPQGLARYIAGVFNYDCP